MLKTKNTHVKLGLLLFLSLTFAGCPKVEEPPVKELPISFPVAEQSIISIPLETKVSDLRNKIWEDISTLKFDEPGKFENSRIKSLGMSINGNDVNISVRASVRARKRIRFGPFRKTIKCTVDATISLKGKMSLGDNLNLVIKVDERGNRVKIHKFCNKLVKYILRAVQSFFKKKISKKLAKKINESIRKSSDKLNYKEKMIAKVKEISAPRKVGDNIWLTTNANKVVYTNLSAKNGILKFNVAMYAKPQLTYSSKRPIYKPLKISIRKVSSIKPKTVLAVDLRLPYAEVEKRMTSTIKQYAKKKFSWLLYKPGKISFYPSGKKLVVSLEILRKINDSKLVTLYFEGEPVYDEAKQEVYLKDLDFTASSSSAILLYATTAAKKDIIKKIRESARFSIRKQKAKIDSSIKNYIKTNDGTTVSAKFNPIKVTNIFTVKKGLRIHAKTVGQLKVIYKFTPSTRQNIYVPLAQSTVLEEECLECENDYYDGEILIDEDNNITFTGKDLSYLLEEDKTPTISVYPNPTKGNLSISSPIKIKDVLIYNHQGNKVGRYTNTTDFNIYNYPRGTYIMHIVKEDNTREIRNLIKE